MYEDDEAVVLKEAAEELASNIVGRRIVSVSQEAGKDLVRLTLDNGKRVILQGYGDCCAFASASVVGQLAEHDNAITSVTSTDDGEEWFVYVGTVPVLEFSAYAGQGSGYYGYGITVTVMEESE